MGLLKVSPEGIAPTPLIQVFMQHIFHSATFRATGQTREDAGLCGEKESLSASHCTVSHCTRTEVFSSAVMDISDFERVYFLPAAVADLGLV